MKQLDTVVAGNKIQMFIADGSDHDPQTMAMLQAFYSRSTKSIADRVEGMTPEQVQQSLLKYYLGYGHRSIGQCGSFVVFLEDVSIFAAKAIQHHPLYNGQETSTRYYDFYERPFINPLGIGGIERALKDLYRHVFILAEQRYSEEAVTEGFELDANMKRTIKAKAFDLARCLLTAGFTTKLSWSTTFDQAQDRLSALLNSGVSELQAIAGTLAQALHDKYPSAMPEPESLVSDYRATMPLFDDTFAILVSIMEHSDVDLVSHTVNSACLRSSLQDIKEDEAALELMQRRKRGEPVPRSFARFGSFDFAFTVDYASFRDIHRHRNGTMYFPHYNADSSIHDWYISEMDRLEILDSAFMGSTVSLAIQTIYDDYVSRAEAEACRRFGHGTNAYHAALMYYVPMGTVVVGALRCDLPQAIYLSELRSSRTVHPTARIVARELAHYVRKALPESVPLYTDSFDGLFASTRGRQTILEKGEQ